VRINKTSDALIRQCTQCGHKVERGTLTVKRAMFQKMGVGASAYKVRIMAWLCPECLVKDPDFNREKGASPVFTPSEELAVHD
jgi:hypothetical protein